MPECSYYVNLDVIPGKPNRARDGNDIRTACKQGFINYKKMCEQLPKEKVIPVFHQIDEIQWLESYIKEGARYIGISPANDRTTDQKASWLAYVNKTLQKYPCVKTHGFAVTSFRLMKSFPWTSVDSATWVVSSGLGKIFVPNRTNGAWDYSVDPWYISVSDRSSDRSVHGQHLESLSKLTKQRLYEYLEQEGMSIGKSEERPAQPKEKPGKNERWYDKKKTKIITITEKGVATDDQKRKWLNMMFFQRANQALDIERIYLAGLGIEPKIQRTIENRLMSYADISESRSTRKEFLYHCGRSIKL